MTYVDHSDYNRYIASLPECTLSEEELVDLAKEAQEGDLDARSAFVNAQLKWVARLVHKHYGSTGYEMDLISAANRLLLQLVDSYKPDAGRFFSYAYGIIRKELATELKVICCSVSAPRGHLKWGTRLWQVYREALGEGKNSEEALDAATRVFLRSERGTDLDELSPEKQVKARRHVSSIMAVVQPTVSLNDQVGDAKNASELMAMIPDDGVTPEEGYLQSEDMRQLRRAVGMLKPKHRYVLVRSYGLFGYTPLRAVEIAELLQVSRQRVNAVRQNAERELREILLQLRKDEEE